MASTPLERHAALLPFLGAALRERRLALGEGFSQEEIAHRAGLTVRAYQQIEFGRVNPRVVTLYAMAEALKTNAQSLLDRADALRAKRKR